MTNLERATVLRRCSRCSWEGETAEQTCQSCSGVLLVIVFSVVNGQRITPTFDEDCNETQMRSFRGDKFDCFKRIGFQTGQRS